MILNRRVLTRHVPVSVNKAELKSVYFFWVLMALKSVDLSVFLLSFAMPECCFDWFGIIRVTQSSVILWFCGVHGGEPHLPVFWSRLCKLSVRETEVLSLSSRLISTEYLIFLFLYKHGSSLTYDLASAANMYSGDKWTWVLSNLNSCLLYHQCLISHMFS